MKPDPNSSPLRNIFSAPFAKVDKKTVLWISLLAIFVWILASDLVNGGKSILLHLSLKRQVSLGQDDAELAGSIERIDRANRTVLAKIGVLTKNRHRFEERAGQIGDLFGRMLSIKKHPARPARNVPILLSQDVSVAYTATIEQILSDLPEWKGLSSLPGVALRSFEIAPGATPGKNTATIAFRIVGQQAKTTLNPKGKFQ
jgi:hypothetical protein